MKSLTPLPIFRSSRSLEERGTKRSAFSDFGFYFRSGSYHGGGGFDPPDEERPRFHHLSRQFLVESAREQTRELFVLGLIVLTSAWPVFSMVVTVVHILGQPHP